MQKSKQQLKNESVERFNIALKATRKDIKSLDEKIVELEELEVKEVTAEVLNIIDGMRRDICYARDNVKRIRRALNAST